MRKSTKKTSISILLAALVCLALCIPVAAAQTGSLKILLDEEPCSTISLHRVADMDGTLTADFAGAAISPETLLDTREVPNNAIALKKYALDNGIVGAEQVPEGSEPVFFPDLALGIYLVYCADDDAFDPFLVFIPSNINGEIVYDIEAQPKMEDPTEPSDPTEPNDPSDPPDIPQTGNNLVPMYLLLAVGSAVVVVGLLMILRGRKESYE